MPSFFKNIKNVVVYFNYFDIFLSILIIYQTYIAYFLSKIYSLAIVFKKYARIIGISKK